MSAVGKRSISELACSPPVPEEEHKLSEVSESTHFKVLPQLCNVPDNIPPQKEREMT